jgi:hypothetical protein
MTLYPLVPRRKKRASCGEELAAALWEAANDEKTNTTRQARRRGIRRRIEIAGVIVAIRLASG